MLYVLAAVVVRDDQAESVREQLRAGLRHWRPRFHWRDEEQHDREAMAKLVDALDLLSLVAVCTPMDQHRPERARRCCLTHLLWELEQREVFAVLLESRVHRDRDDQMHIANARRARQLGTALRFAFGAPLQEPRLWLPDLVAVAVA